MSIKGEQFLLYDSEINETNRLLVFGTRKMLTILRDSSSWYADGTFKVVPSQFFQLYTIHCEKDGYIIPCVYALMTNKREVTYNKLFKNLIEIEPDLNPSHIMVDFEKASLNALEENFIAVVSGCFFHLSQSIYRQIQAKGLTTQYLEDQDFAIRMKMLASLAFVPEHDVIDSFTILMGRILRFRESSLGSALILESVINPNPLESIDLVVSSELTARSFILVMPFIISSSATRTTTTLPCLSTETPFA